jgi:hypothetical protein
VSLCLLGLGLSGCTQMNVVTYITN